MKVCSRIIPFVAACLFMISATAAEKPNPAMEATKEANAAVLKDLPFSDKTAFELAHKGFVAPLPQAMIKGQKGNVVWDSKKFAFI